MVACSDRDCCLPDWFRRFNSFISFTPLSCSSLSYSSCLSCCSFIKASTSRAIVVVNAVILSSWRFCSSRRCIFAWVSPAKNLISSSVVKRCDKNSPSTSKAAASKGLTLSPPPTRILKEPVFFLRRGVGDVHDTDFRLRENLHQMCAGSSNSDHVCGGSDLSFFFYRAPHGVSN